MQLNEGKTKCFRHWRPPADLWSPEVVPFPGPHPETQRKAGYSELLFASPVNILSVLVSQNEIIVSWLRSKAQTELDYHAKITSFIHDDVIISYGSYKSHQVDCQIIVKWMDTNGCFGDRKIIFWTHSMLWMLVSNNASYTARDLLYGICTS